MDEHTLGTLSLMGKMPMHGITQRGIGNERQRRYLTGLLQALNLSAPGRRSHQQLMEAADLPGLQIQLRQPPHANCQLHLPRQQIQ